MRYQCEECGCNLDPGEGKLCDECRERKKNRLRYAERMHEAVRVSDAGQYEMRLQEAIS